MSSVFARIVKFVSFSPVSLPNCVSLRPRKTWVWSWLLVMRTKSPGPSICYQVIVIRAWYVAGTVSCINSDLEVEGEGGKDCVCSHRPDFRPGSDAPKTHICFHLASCRRRREVAPRKHSIQVQISKIKVESMKILNQAGALWTQLPLGPIICEGKSEVLKPLRARRVRHREEPWTGNTVWCSASGASEGPHVVTWPVKGSRARVHGLQIPAVQFGLHLWNPGGTQGWWA